MRVRFGEFLLDTDSRQLFGDGREVHLQPRTFELLELLVRSRPKALSKNHIRGQLWPDVVVGEASLTVAVAELRSALGDDAKEPRFVRTVYGFGYAFAGEAVPDGKGEGSPSSPASGIAPRVLWEKRVIPLVEGENVIGRDEGVTVRIDAPSVSRRHACISVVGAWATIEDLASKNGTYVGEGAEPITGPTELREGARFRLGRVLLVFRCLPDVASTKTEHSV